MDSFTATATSTLIEFPVLENETFYSSFISFISKQENLLLLLVFSTTMQTHLNVADNSGARKLMCIRIIGASNRRYAQIGDVVVAVIKEAIPNTPLERSEVIRAVIVRTCKELKRNNGMIIRYDDNAAVVIDQEGNPKGTRIFGAIARELRQLNLTKIVSLAPEVL